MREAVHLNQRGNGIVTEMKKAVTPKKTPK